jgi:CubicO group peptidase (beta-lactamase class C family)
MADIQGFYDDLFTAVPNALAAMLDDGDAGGSVAVFVDGEPVVDVWGGFADADRTIPWERDTIVNVWSVTKTMTALCALILADRGELDLAAPVCRYWPEFGTAGKEKVLVRHLLAHRRPARLGRAGRGAVRLALRHGTARGARSSVGAGHGGRLPLAHSGIPGGRGRTPCHRPRRGRVPGP